MGKGGGIAGFTLIEVSLAVLIIGLGLLSVFSLFPSGLRSAEEGAADTHAGLFGQTVMSGLHGNAATVTNWNDWCDDAFFDSAIRANVLGAGRPVQTGAVTTVAFPASDPDQYLRYRLTLGFSTNRHYAFLEVCDGQYGGFDYPAKFYTEFIFQGM